MVACLTFMIGLNADPDKFPQADGVKLCEPTYAQPMLGVRDRGVTSMISSSESGSVTEPEAFFPDDRPPDPNGASLNVPRIICTRGE